MKKHNILKVVLTSILITILLTWILPTANFSSELEVGARSQLGIFDIMSYFVEIFRYFPYVILMVLATGMFYGVCYKIPSYRALLDRLVAKFKGKEAICLSIIMVLIALLVSVAGINFAIIFVFPFIISLVLLMGYNKLVAASVVVGSTSIGMLGATLGTNITGYINYILSTDVYDEMITKIILLALGLVILIYTVLKYAKTTKNDVDNVNEFVPTIEYQQVEVKKDSKDKKDSKTKKDSKKTKTEKVVPTKKVSVWPFVVIFDLVIIILAICAFDWEGIFNIDWFTTALNAVNDFKVADFPIFAKLLGSVSAYGNWTLNYEMPTLIILATCLLAFVYGLKFDEFLDGVEEGIKKALKPGIYMFVVYLVLIIATYNPFQLNITKFLLDLTKGLNVITMTIVAMFASVFNIESIYTAQSTLPYITTVITDTTLYPLLGIIFQAVYGITMLVAPTSVILLGVLTYLDISYTQWLKHIWKLFVALLIVLIVVFLVLFLI